MKNKSKKEIIYVDNKSRFSGVVFLFIILSITSCIICYVVGKYSWSNIEGELIDTIIIEEPQNTDKLPVYLTGKVSYSDGTPYEGTVRLFSKMQETKTDKNGVFFFQNIVYGKHSLLIVDDNGNTISEINLTINQSTKTDKIVINKNKLGYEVSVGINNALIELNIELNKEKKEIDINKENASAVSYKGTVITPEKITAIKANVIQTINGNKVMPEGIIVLPNIGIILANGIFISNTGTVHYPLEEVSLPNNLKIEADGTIVLSDKTIIKPDGTIIRPEIEETKPVPKEEPIESETPEDPDPLTWDAPIVKQGDMRWDQLATLNLFSTNNSKIEGKIYPGVSGEYEFSIENANPYDILFSIDMKEQEHEAGSINLSYRLKYYDHDLSEFVYVIGDNNTYLKPDELAITDKVILSANSNIAYILEWIWGNENNKEQDLKDGRVGSSLNKVHFVDMTIYIQNS